MMFSELPDYHERFLFFTGKGGVGKTSLACAISVSLADTGRRVLLISTDPASNLDEVLETQLSGQPTEVEGVPLLFAMNINPDEAAAAYRERIVGPYRGVLPDAAVANIEEQLSGACTTEIASFNEFSRLIGDPEAINEFDHIVLDTAPTGHTLRLLNLPAAWSDFLAENQTGSSCLGPLSGLNAQKKIYDQAVQTLKNPTQTALVLVARAESASLREAAKAGSELLELGLGNQRLIVNAVFRAARSDDPLAAALEQANHQALSNMPTSLRDLPCTQIPFRPTGAVGLARIRAMARRKKAESVTVDDDETFIEQVNASDLDTLVDELAETGRGVVMTMGKGGVGKTTLAVDIARRLAASGHSVILATTDPADHVSGQFDELPANLTVEAINPKEETRRHVAHVLATTGADLDSEALALLKEELKSPCIEEIAVFTAFAR
ncbi:MAG: TRC40/GET3/ArsA family transport-energizing ATPase, partial [Puniceicoccales bacterium]